MALRGDENAPDLEVALAAVGAALLRESLAGWLAGTLPAIPQSTEGVTLTHPLTREDGRLDPARGAAVLERQVRAYQPWPGSFLESADGGRLAVWRAGIVAWENGARPANTDEAGTLVSLGAGLGLVTADGILELLEVQRSGGRRMSGAELFRGRPAWVGERVVTSGVAGG